MKLVWKAGAFVLGICILVQPVLAQEVIRAPETPSEPEISLPEPLPEPVEPPLPAVEEPATPEPEPVPAPTEEAAEPESLPEDEVVMPENLDYVPGEVIVKFKENAIDLADSSGEEEVEVFADAQGLELGESIEEANIAVLETASDVVEVAEELSDNPNVEFAEPNYLYQVDAIDTNDTHRALLWALENTGQEVNGDTGTADADIDGKEALLLSQGDGVLVAVIDNGVDYDHPDLSDNMWDGSSCLDSTGAALGGCLHGYNFSSADNGDPANDPAPAHHHGTHVAGIIAASMNNNVGVMGIAPDATIMALRTDLGGSGSTTLATTAIIEAIAFAEANGADVINASFGGGSQSQIMRDAIQGFSGLFIAAAGNDGDDIDAEPFYPASYDLANVISVAASDQDDAQASFSNYGDTNVDLHAPGVTILSTHPSGYAYLSGTSMSTPFVTGAAASLLAYAPALTTTEVKETILESGDTIAGLSGKSATGKRLNLNNALGCVTEGATSTISITATVVNDNGRTATTSDFSFTLVGSTTQAFEIDGTNILTVDPCEEHSVTASFPNYSLSATDCSTIFLLRDATGSCLMTFNDDPIVSSGGGGGGGGGGSKKKKKKKLEPKKVEKKPVKSPTPTPLPKVQGVTAPQPASSTHTFTLDRAVGSQGTDVTELQKVLVAKGFLIATPTGYFGPLTQAALRAFQAANGIVPASGYLGPLTRAKLNTLPR